MNFRMHMSLVEDMHIKWFFLFIFLCQLYQNDSDFETSNGSEFRIYMTYVNRYQKQAKEMNVIFKCVNVISKEILITYKIGINFWM